MAHVFNMSQSSLFLPDGSLDGGWGDLPELLEFGDFVEPYWDSDAEKDLNTSPSPQPPILSPPPPAPSPPPTVLLSSAIRGPRLVRAPWTMGTLHMEEAIQIPSVDRRSNNEPLLLQLCGLLLKHQGPRLVRNTPPPPCRSYPAGCIVV